MRKAIAGGVVILGLLAGAAGADETSHRRAAATMLDAAGTPVALQTAMDQMLQVQLRAQPQIAPYQEVLRGFLEKHMGYEAIKGELIDLYVVEFTEAELAEIAAFYRTPTGAKAVSRLPILMARSGQIAERRVRANQGELVRMLEEERQRRGLPR